MIFRIGVTATSSKVAAGAVGVVVAEMAASTSLAITRPLGPEPCSLFRSTLAPLSRRMVLARGLMKVRVAGVAGVVGAGAGVAGVGVGVAGVGVGVGAAAGTAAGTAGALSPSFPSRDSLVTLANLGMSSLFSTYMFTPTHHPNDNRNRLTNIHILTSLRHQDLCHVSLHVIRHLHPYFFLGCEVEGTLIRRNL